MPSSDKPHRSTVVSLRRAEQPKSRPVPPSNPPLDPTRAINRKFWLWVISIALFLLPLVVYQQTIFYYFGLRDDYSNIREAHEEPGKILAFTASHGRPIYGFLLQHSFERVWDIQDLQWLRLIGAMGIGLISAASFLLFVFVGWSLVPAACTAASLALLPAAQVIVSWAITWPYTVASLIAYGGFTVAEWALQNRRKWTFFAATLFVTTSALIYQPSSLFYVIPLAAALVKRRGRGFRHNFRSAGLHLGVVFAGACFCFLGFSITHSSKNFPHTPPHPVCTCMLR